MENKTTTYYTLKYCQTDSLHKKGEVIVIPSGDLRIGQQEDCKVRFKNSTDYEDEQYAIIRPTRNEGEWQIVPTSEFVNTFVNGIPVNLVHYLNDGDRITFDQEDQELLFKVHNDDKFDAAKGIQIVAAPLSRKLLSFVIVLPLVLFGLVAWFMYENNNAEEKRNELLESVQASVLQISVDSVYYMKGDSLIDTFSYQDSEGHVINGTAFLTADGRIITARHCIEPWLNENVDEANRPEDVKSVPARWAMRAETDNQEEGTNQWKVIAVCHFYRGQNGMEQFGRSYRSTEFEVDNTRDNIVEKGDFETLYYWRSIKETPSYKDMMLGDVAWVKTDSIGLITIASEESMEKLLTSRQNFYFIGYPDHNTMRGLNTVDGKMQMDYEKGKMIAHSGDLIHGYSGAPALVVKDDKAYAVGVVSRIDANGGGRAYSVPVSELKKKGGKK